MTLTGIMVFVGIILFIRLIFDVEKFWHNKKRIKALEEEMSELKTDIDLLEQDIQISEAEYRESMDLALKTGQQLVQDMNDTVSDLEQKKTEANPKDSE